MDNVRFSETLNSPINRSCSNLGIEINKTSRNYNPTLYAEFPDFHTVNSIRIASDKIRALRQDLKFNTAIGWLELKISALETAMSRFLNNQKFIMKKRRKSKTIYKRLNHSVVAHLGQLSLPGILCPFFDSGGEETYIGKQQPAYL